MCVFDRASVLSCCVTEMEEPKVLCHLRTANGFLGNVFHVGNASLEEIAIKKEKFFLFSFWMLLGVGFRFGSYRLVVRTFSDHVVEEYWSEHYGV